MSTCRSCGAEIIWAETENGKRIPMDVQPTIPKGMFFLIAGDPPLAISAASNRAACLYESHFATCPDADEHRKPAAPPDDPSHKSP